MTARTDRPEKDAPSFLRSRRDILLGGAMLAAGAAAFIRKPRHLINLLGSNKLDSLVPKHFDGWQFQTASGLVLPPKDQLRDRIYSQLLTRAYRRGEDYVMLLIAYSSEQDGTVQIHRPEVCYPASGYRLTQNLQENIDLGRQVHIPARYILADGQTVVEQLLYWTRVGQYFPSRWIEQRTAVAMSNLRGEVPDGVLVRVSTTAPGDNSDLLQNFIRSLLHSVNGEMRSVLIGTG